MKDIKNSIVATDKGRIKDATIRIADKESDNENGKGVKNSIIANGESQITNVTIDINRTKKKSFWRGSIAGGVVASLIAAAIWYFVQKFLE